MNTCPPDQSKPAQLGSEPDAPMTGEFGIRPSNHGYDSDYIRQSVSGNRRLKKTIRSYVILIFVLISLELLGNDSTGGNVKLYESDSGKRVEMRVGDDLEIVLPANPTTGYVWNSSTHDSDQLRLVNSDFYPDSKNIGGGGMEIIKFRAEAAGKSQVKLMFHRPFERAIPPLKTFVVTIVINK